MSHQQVSHISTPSVFFGLKGAKRYGIGPDLAYLSLARLNRLGTILWTTKSATIYTNPVGPTLMHIIQLQTKKHFTLQSPTQ
jgi:hypothetical protein